MQKCLLEIQIQRPPSRHFQLWTIIFSFLKQSSSMNLSVVIAYICIGKVEWFALYICGNIWYCLVLYMTISPYTSSFLWHNCWCVRYYRLSLCLCVFLSVYCFSNCLFFLIGRLLLLFRVLRSYWQYYLVFQP